MKLTKEEFDALSPLYECIVEIPAFKSNTHKFEDGTEIEIVTDVDLNVDDNYKRDLMNKIGRRLVDMPRENEEKKKLRAEYKRLKGEVSSKDTPTARERGNRQATRFGVLVKKPRTVTLREGFMFTCELDCEVGEMVYWDGFWASQVLAQKDGEKGDDYVIEVEDKKYLRIPSTSLFAVRNGDEFRGLNGHLICEPMPEKEKVLESGLYAPADKKSTTRSKVVAVSRYNPKYRNANMFKNTEVKVGDVIHSEDHFQIELDKTAASTTSYVRVLNSSILFIED